ncbi:MAG: heme-binding domain-containing protein [Anaerolinea sp.]|nr:heme-binding domain-containing protein [Anaerolinea sp.]
MNISSLASERRFPKWLVWGIGLLLVVFVLMQLVRFVVPDFQLDNPPVTQQVMWSSPEAEQLWKQACADCHSNETVYPWYSYVAPVGWLVAHDVHEGRENLNISTDRRIEWDEMIEEIEEGGMPLPNYVLMHPDANLTDAQKETLMAGIRATFR